MILLVTLTIYKFFTETCRSKSDGNLRREKMREFQKSFAGNFYRKVFWESFGKFCRKFYRKILTGKKGFTGEMGNQVWIETWKVADPSQLQLRVTDLLAPPDLPNFLT